jgi:hypothetical protein
MIFILLIVISSGHPALEEKGGEMLVLKLYFIIQLWYGAQNFSSLRRSTLTEERSQGEVVDSFKFAIINHPGLRK